MEKILSLSYLETLSSQDLIALADDSGIDIPENLHRKFIIGELLDYSLELSDERNSEELEVLSDDPSDKTLQAGKTLPPSYNETDICIILRNPAWAYVYWDIREADVQRLTKSAHPCSLNLRVSFFDTEDSASPVESFELSLKTQDRSEYVLINPERNYLRIDLFVRYSDKTEENLCVSRKIEIPHGNPVMNEYVPGKELEFPPAVELSGIKDLLLHHYQNHRQSFS
ncbi:MAG: DUF4912 domain-containing protein [Treponema sp.]|nr:DUF4912 domain-containing protein [Treponema sp.]